jgi:outer membrane protein
MSIITRNYIKHLFAGSGIALAVILFDAMDMNAQIALPYTVGKNVQDSLSLKECIQFTLEHNINSTIYKNNASVAAEKIREYKAAMLPTVTGTATFDYNIKLQTSVIPAGTFSPTETKLQIGNKYSTGAYLEADQTILNRAYILDIKSSKIDKAVSDLNVQKENETLIYNTAISYYSILTYSEQQKLLLENERQDQQLQDILKLRYDQGVIKQSEYDRARVNLKNVQSDLALNRTNYEQALNTLKNAMGIDLQTPFSIADTVNYGQPVSMPSFTGAFDGHDLIDYKIDEQNILLKDLEVQKQRAAYLPTLSVYAKYGVNAFGTEFNNAFNAWFDYSAVGLKLSVPIFSGFKRNSQLAQSKITAKNQRLTQQLNLEGYKLEYKNSGARLFSSYTSLIKNKETMDLAGVVLASSTVEYREGSSTYSTFLDDDYSYKQAQSNYITSLIDFFNSRLSFEKSKGTLITYLNTNK